MGIICLLVEIGLTVLPNIGGGGAEAPKVPPFATALIVCIIVINVGSDTFGNPVFQKGLQN